MSKPDRLLSVRQVMAEYLPGMSRAGMYRAIETGDMPAVRYGKKLLIRESTVRKFIDRLEPAVNREPLSISQWRNGR